jgi:hypothetical protein
MIIPLQVTDYYLANSLSGLINATLAAPLLLAAAKVGLGTSVIVPALNTAIGVLGEASFIGYAESVTVVWTTPTNYIDTTPSSSSQAFQFRCTTAGSTQNIANLFITDGVASPSQGILASGLLPQTIPITNVGDGFTVTVNWNLYNGNGGLFATITQ